MIYTYQTLHEPVEGDYRESGSKFIAYVFPVSARTEMEEHMATLKVMHAKARHHCYAYRFIEREEIAEFSSDAGEPSGSAGLPILNVLRREQLLNVYAVVVRYFGGTKLGIPGLIHAYGESVRDALKKITMVTITRRNQWRIIVPLSVQPRLYAACKQTDIQISNPEFSEDFRAVLSVPLENNAQLINDFLAKLAGSNGNTTELIQWLGISLERTDAEVQD